MPHYDYWCMDKRGTFLSIPIAAETYEEAARLGDERISYWSAFRFQAIVWRHPEREREVATQRQASVNALFAEHFRKGEDNATDVKRAANPASI